MRTQAQIRGRYLLSRMGKDKLVPVAASRDRAPTLFDSRPRRVAGVRPSERQLLFVSVTAQLATLLQDALGSAYRLERELEAGGMSRLFLATDVKLNRQVVVKVLPPDLVSTASIARFKREIELTVRLQHPHILPIITSGEWEDGIFYITPFITGESLRERIAREKGLPLDDILRILKDVSGALAFAHQRGIIHRDIKPGNILLADAHAILADFGIARAVSGTQTPLTESGVTPGTPAYMAPELVTDERADVYALGVIAFEMLFGRVPKSPATALSEASHLRRERAHRDKLGMSGAMLKLLERSLALNPSTRIATAREFREQLDVVANARTRRLALVGAGIGTAAVLLIGGTLIQSRLPEAGVGKAADTTRIVVFPVEGELPLGGNQATEYLIEALGRWRGITLADPFEVRDALSRLSRNIVTNADARAVARSLNAGRYVRGRLMLQGDSIRLIASLYDVAKDAPLRTVRSRIAGHADTPDLEFTRLADSLLLRAGGSSRTDRASGTTSLPAIQAFASGLAALGEWDLTRADSAFGLAWRFDTAYVRARVWQAQVREWDLRQPESFRGLSDASVIDSISLSERERSLARGLWYISHGEFANACRTYSEMRRKNDRDFAAWFGLGRCQSLDEVVVRDSHSPSGWAYRSSYHRAVQAYAKAFELLPSMNRGFAKTSFGSLSSLLFTRSDRLRLGSAAAPDTSRFAAHATWQGDSLAFVPFPLSDVHQAKPNTILPGVDEALRQQRALFHRIATAWATALPKSPAAKEALSISMDLVGDESAANTAREARDLSLEGSDRIRLGTLEIFIRLKNAVPDRIRELESIRRLADSLIVASKLLTSEAKSIAAPLAQVIGDCDEAIALSVAKATPLDTPIDLPQSLLTESTRLVVQASMGCNAAGGSASLDSLTSHIVRTVAAPSRALAETMLTAQAGALLFPSDSGWLSRFVTSTSPPIYRAELASLVGRAAEARQIIGQVQVARTALRRGDGFGSPDAVLSEARVLVVAHDTSGAISWLDSALTHVRDYTPAAFQQNAAAMGSMIQLMSLRAELADATGDRSAARRWAGCVVTLWRNSSPSLAGLVTRMRAIAGPHV